MFLDFLEKREETTDSITLTDEEKIFLKVFGIDSEQPAAAMSLSICHWRTRSTNRLEECL